MDYFRSQILEVEKISPRQMVGKNILFEAVRSPVAYLEVLLDRVSPYMFPQKSLVLSLPLENLI